MNHPPERIYQIEFTPLYGRLICQICLCGFVAYYAWGVLASDLTRLQDIKIHMNVSDRSLSGKGIFALYILVSTCFLFIYVFIRTHVRVKLKEG